MIKSILTFAVFILFLMYFENSGAQECEGDCLDPDCFTDPLCQEGIAFGNCDDGINNNPLQNALTDCADPNCSGDPVCEPPPSIPDDAVLCVCVTRFLKIMRLVDCPESPLENFADEDCRRGEEAFVTKGIDVDELP